MHAKGMRGSGDHSEWLMTTEGERFVLRWRYSDGTWHVLTEAEFALDPIRTHLEMRPRTYFECVRWRARAPLPAEFDIVAAADMADDL